MPKSDLLERAGQELAEGNCAAARTLCDQCLANEPQNARAWFLRGISFAQQGDLTLAASDFEQAAALAEDVASYHYNLGLAYRGLKRNEDAVTAYRQAIQLNPDFHEANTNLGNTLLDLEQLEEAIAVLNRVAEQHPNDPIAHYNLGNALHEAHRYDDAIQYLERAIQLDPNLTAARENLSRVLASVGRLDDALVVWKALREHEPDNAMARHMIASLAGEDIPDRCDDEFVRETFDVTFAESFERQLSGLQYRGPELVAAALENANLPERPLDVLDAGCGTGLAAPLLHTRAKWLVGVDLSPDMLEVARRRKVYDKLVEAELTQFMSEHSEAYDLIVCCDTYCYFGDPTESLAAAYRCLRDDGVFVLSGERLTAEDVAKPGFILQHSGRYRHASDYVLTAAQESGFTIERTAEEILRHENGREVPGLVVTLGKEISGQVLS